MVRIFFYHIIIFMSSKIIFITNDNKLLEYGGELFNSEYEIINFISNEPDIDSLDCKEVLDHKLEQVYEQVIKIHGSDVNVICEKVGLSIDNMKGYPGAQITNYHKTLGNNGICFFNGNSNAIMTTGMGLINPSGKYIYEEKLQGKIVNTGNNSTDDWKSIFIPHLSFNNRQYFSKTYTQLPLEIRYKINGKINCIVNLKKHIVKFDFKKPNNNRRTSVSNLTKNKIENIIKNEVIRDKMKSKSRSPVRSPARSPARSPVRSQARSPARSLSKSMLKTIINDLF